MNHLLPDKCPTCGEVVRNDMSVIHNNRGERVGGHVQFSCNYEVEIQVRSVEGAPEIGDPVIIRQCRKGQIWPSKK